MLVCRTILLCYNLQLTRETQGAIRAFEKMKGEWIILLWVLLGVVFLVKTAPVGDLVRRVRRQSPVIQAMVALCLLVAVITGGPKLVETNELSSSFQAEIVAPENSSLIIQKSSLLSTGWNHDSADTDGDGIPDLWEKWTHGNRQVADGNIDRDEDGLTDLEEFQNQTDPRTADTDGDGFDLFSLLGGNSLPYKDDLTFTTTGCTINDGVLSYSDDPGSYSPDACLVTVVHTPSTIALDHLWVVVNASTAQTEFNGWCSANTNLSWTLGLPQPFSSIEIASGTPQDPEPGSPNEWQPPEPLNSFLHHDACFGMRSSNDGESGHQATYDAVGSLITSSIAAGTADYRRPYLVSGFPNWQRHLNADVKPFILALQLDGNPVQPLNIYRDLSRPCLYQGGHADTYITLRPIIPTGVQPR